MILPPLAEVDTVVPAGLPARIRFPGMKRLIHQDDPLSEARAIQFVSSMDIIVAATSGGKDSMAAILAMLDFLDLHGLNIPVVLVHADLGGAEWPGVVELVRRQAAALDLPLIIVKRHGELVKRDSKAYRKGERYGDLVHHMERNGYPFRKDTRACTSEHKRGPIGRAITAICASLRKRLKLNRAVRCLNVVGLRAAESPARDRLLPVSINHRFSSGVKTVYTLLPVHGWTEADVWRRVWESGIEWAWPYDVGAPRLSCPYCIFASEAAWRLASFLIPSLGNRYIGMEVKTDRTLRQGASVLDSMTDVWDCLSVIDHARERGLERIRTWEA